MGGPALPPGAPVPDDGAVVGHDPGAALPFPVVEVEIWALGCLGSLVRPCAVDTAGLASDLTPASEAGPE
jgi:hypothetical protein